MLREVLQVLRSEYAFALITASLAVLLAVIAFELVGYLGLAMLGLLTLLVCANVELGKAGPLGGINNPELHAWPLLANCTPPEVEALILALSLEQPAFGQIRIANEVR
jgi:hypothetical protein